MKFLTGFDSFFLLTDTDTHYQHMVSTVLLDPSTAPEKFTVHTVKHLFANRLHLLPSFRQRIMEVPYHLGPPAFIDDPDFAIDNHFCELSLPEGSTLDMLAKKIENFISTPLDRSKPL